MKLIITLISLFFSCTAIAQFASGTKLPTQDSSDRFDHKGKKHGLWGQPVACPDGGGGCHEYGYYDHGRKTNLWYKLNGEGELLAKENYRNNALDGEVKYYDAGHLTCIGHYRGLNPDNLYDTIAVADPETGIEKLRPILNDKGSQRNGTWKYYDEETGRLVKEEDYQIDELIYRKEYPVSKQDSTRYAQRNANLPMNKKKNYTPPPSKIFSYTNFK
jgi:hypothetical protein